jgi:hypothetical protein
MEIIMSIVFRRHIGPYQKGGRKMTCLGLCRTAVVGAALAMFGFDPAFAQQPDVDPAIMCDAAVAAYQTYAVNNDDPDKDDATARVTEGASDCKEGRHDVGLRKINEGTAMIHDHIRTKRK